MRRKALRTLWVVAFAAVTFVVLGMFGGFVYASASSASTAQYQYGSDTAVIGTTGQVSCLNLLRTACASTQFWTASIALEGAFHFKPDLTYEPRLVEGVDVASGKKKIPTFALTYHIRPEAVWSDDVPVSADDFIFTYETIVDPANEIADRFGYDRITQATKLDAKTVRFDFSQPVAAWRTLFPLVLPKHVLEGHDFDQVWANEIADPDTHEPIGSGPFLVTAVQPGWMSLSRNPSWWGAQTPALENVVFRFDNDPNPLIQAFHEGNVDVLYTGGVVTGGTFPPQPGIVVESHPGAAMEHIDFNLGSTTMPMLAQEWFREAVAHAIDRAAVAGSVSPTIPGLQPLENLLYLSQQPEYEAHFDRYDYSPSKVAALMTDNGCALGVDGIWVCGGTRASIKFATTTGNARRAAVQAQIRDQAANAGIELVADNSPPGVLFGSTTGRLVTGNYELAMFAWVDIPDPRGRNLVYGCGGVSNWKAYCSPTFDDEFAKSETEVDPRKRASLVNKADATLADDVPTIPLYQTPTFLAYRTVVHGPTENISLLDGPTWNVEAWTKD